MKYFKAGFWTFLSLALIAILIKYGIILLLNYPTLIYYIIIGIIILCLIAPIIIGIFEFFLDFFEGC